MSGLLFILKTAVFGLASVVFTGSALLSILLACDLLKLIFSRRQILASYDNKDVGKAAWTADVRLGVAIQVLCLIAAAVSFTLAWFVGAPMHFH